MGCGALIPPFRLRLVTRGNTALCFMALLLALFVTVVFITLAHHLIQTCRSFAPSPASDARLVRIQGRWKEVHASLGLPSLPDHILVASDPPLVFQEPRYSRFDLRRRRELEESESRPSLLYFSPGALDSPSLTTEQISRTFREVALIEKAMSPEQERARGPDQKTQRHTSSRIR
jgi:hypothetical protein